MKKNVAGGQLPTTRVENDFPAPEVPPALPPPFKLKLLNNFFSSPPQDTSTTFELQRQYFNNLIINIFSDVNLEVLIEN